jgi:hypothetical protein
MFYAMVKYDQALPLYEACVDRRRSALGKDHPASLASLCHVAGSMYNQGKYDRALALYVECMYNGRRRFGTASKKT